MANTEGMAALGGRCETVKLKANEAHFAAVAGNRDEFADAIERLLDETSRLRLAYRAWLASGPHPVSDSRASV